MTSHIPMSSAAPQMSSNGNNEDDTYNYYYHHDKGYNSPPQEYVSDWSHEWAKMSGRIQQPKCVIIPQNMSLCQNIGYEKMMLPNLLDHDSLKEVTQQAGSWVPLVNINCHPDTKVFLCSLFSPVCLDRLIYPCRSLCENVRASCESRMNQHGFEWPDMLNCNKYPVDNDMCITPISEMKPDDNCTACRHPQTHEALIDHYCRADIAMRVTLKKFIRRDGSPDLELSLRKKRKFYKVNNVEKKEAKNLPVVLEGGASCSCSSINQTQEKYLLMGTKRDGKIVINYGMIWKRNDKEFKKGLRAIRKGDCKKLFESVIEGIQDDDKPPVKREKGGKGKGRKGGKGKRKGKKGGKKGRKGKKKKGDKGKGRKGKGRKGRKGNRKGKKGDNVKGSLSNGTTQMSRAEREEMTLNNLKKATN